MAIGQRIKYFRNRIGMTQKQLGEQLGFKGKTSDVRMAQYESEARVPKIDLVKQMSQIFDINTHALTVPDIDTHIGLMHTLFALEDMYGLKVKNVDEDNSISAWTLPYSLPAHLSMKCFVHGWNKLTSWKTVKSARKNMMNGDISIRNWILTRNVPRYHLRN